MRICDMGLNPSRRNPRPSPGMIFTSRLSASVNMTRAPPKSEYLTMLASSNGAPTVVSRYRDSLCSERHTPRAASTHAYPHGCTHLHSSVVGGPSEGRRWLLRRVQVVVNTHAHVYAVRQSQDYARVHALLGGALDHALRQIIKAAVAHVHLLTAHALQPARAAATWFTRRRAICCAFSVRVNNHGCVTVAGARILAVLCQKPIPKPACVKGSLRRRLKRP